jgi:hypothetical protein
VVLVVTISLWVPLRYSNAFLHNRTLLERGLVKNAQIVRKGILVDKSLRWTDVTEPSDNHQLHVRLPGVASEHTICRLGVSRSMYNDSPPGTYKSVTYLSESPQKCRLTASLPGTQSIMLFGLSISAGMILFAAGASFLVFRSYKKEGPGSSGILSTEMKREGGTRCPECAADMKEGYLPVNRGIYWRTLDQPLGMPTLFSGLSGTVSLFSRPRFHAYHCERCKVITFKYGRK